MKEIIWASGFEHTPVKIVSPARLPKILMAIQKKCGNDEFSVLCKGEWTPKIGFLLTEELYIPKQIVTPTSVDYEEDISLLKAQGFSTVIHSHPFSTKNASFSSADEESINVHFPCSILIDKSGWAEAVLNIKIGECHVKLETKDFASEEEDAIELGALTDNIKKRTYVAPVQPLHQRRLNVQEDFYRSGANCLIERCADNYHGYCFQMSNPSLCERARVENSN